MTVRYKALIAVTAAAPVLAAAAPAVAATTTDEGTSPQVLPPSGGHFVTWKNGTNGKYLHVVNASTANGALVNTYTGSGSCADHGATDVQCAEEWSQVSTGIAQEFAYVNANSGLCLSDPNSDYGVEPIQYSCGKFPTNKRWLYGNTYSGDAGPVIGVLFGAAGNTEGARYMCVKGTSGDLSIYPGISYNKRVGDYCEWK